MKSELFLLICINESSQNNVKFCIRVDVDQKRNTNEDEEIFKFF